MGFASSSSYCKKSNIILIRFCFTFNFHIITYKKFMETGLGLKNAMEHYFKAINAFFVEGKMSDVDFELIFLSRSQKTSHRLK